MPLAALAVPRTGWLGALGPFLPGGSLGLGAPGGGPCVAFVGAGGKTTALFALGRQAREAGAAVILTTTTALRDPRQEEGRGFDGFLFEGELPDPLALPRPSLTVLAGGLREGGKIGGIPVESCSGLKGACDLLLVEADGSRGLPLKAYGPGEPLLPPCTDILVACLGLGAFGRPAEASQVHRLGVFLALTGLAEGELVGAQALVALVTRPGGLFAPAPPGALRVLCLTQRDLVSPSELASLLEALLPLGSPREGRGSFDLLLLAEGEDLEIGFAGEGRVDRRLGA